MSPKLLMALVALHSVSLAAEEFIELPATKTGSGISDSYNLGAVVEDGNPVYYISVQLKGNYDLERVRAAPLTGGVWTVLDRREIAVGADRFLKLKLLLSKEEVRYGPDEGLRVKIISNRGIVSFPVAKKELLNLVTQAEAYCNAKHQRFLDVIRAEEAATEKVEKERAMSGYDGAPLEPFRQRGNGKISGQGFLLTRAGDVKTCAGQRVYLIPVTAWTLKTLGGPYDPTSQFYSKLGTALRTTTADAGGNFEFLGLPYGQYYAITSVVWDVPKEGLQGGVVRDLVTVSGATPTVKLILTK